MPIPIIKPFRRVHVTEHVLSFVLVSHPSSGYAFPCDEHGNVLGDEYRTREDRQKEVDALLADPDYYAPEIKTRSWSYREPAIARCYCGAELELSDPLDNVCECGRCFNSSGQGVVPSWRCDEQGNPYEDYEP